MKAFAKPLSLGFAAGSFAGLVYFGVLWAAVTTGIMGMYGVSWHPVFTLHTLYEQVLSRGLWGFVFALPYLGNWYFFRGLLFGLFPAFAQLFVLFPILQDQGFLGMRLGEMTPLFVLGFNVIWGVTAGLWLKYSE